MTEAEKRTRRCCFTGHRPEKMAMTENQAVKELEVAIRQAIDDGLNVFISGMAPGVDIWAAEIVLRLRDKENLPIKLIAANPHPNFIDRWPEWKKRYTAVIEAADLTRDICDRYKRGVYQIRNEWMVDHSARVIAIWNGKPSGTKNTVDYANRKNVPVVNVYR
jgi:uncharacterized phage-like protein YoqJ